MNNRFLLVLLLGIIPFTYTFANNNKSDKLVISSKDFIVIDSLSGLLYDSFFFDEVLSNNFFLNNIPNEHDKNVISNAWSPSRFTNVIFDGILLNSIINGDFDFFRLPYTISQMINISLLNTNNYGSSSSLVGTVTMRTVNQNINTSRLNVQGGNANGSSFFQYNSGTKNMFWNVSGNFFITNGHSISANKPDTVNILRQNSKSRHESIFGKIGIRDETSLLMISFFWSGLNRQINSNIFYDSLRLDETNGGLALINLEFESSINPLVHLLGNVYYKGSNRNINITSELVSPDIFHETVEDEYTIGANLTTDVKIMEQTSSKFYISYRRDIASMTKYSSNLTTYNRFTSENFNSKLELSRKINSFLDVNGFIEYAIYHPISSSDNVLFDDLSFINASFSLGLNLFENLIWINGLFTGKQVPPLSLLNDNFTDKETKFIYGLESVKSINSTLHWHYHNSKIKINYHVSQFDDIYLPIYADKMDVLIRSEKYTVHGIGVDFSTSLYNFHLIVRGDHKLSTKTDVTLFRRPVSQVFVALAYKFKYGALIIVEAKYSGKNKDYDHLNNDLIEIDSFTEYNLRASMQVFRNNEAFIRVNNITDTYQLKSWGNPIKGRYYIVGINLNF